MTHSVTLPAGRLINVSRSNSLLETIAKMAAVGRQRRELAQLDAHLLADIGVSHKAAQKEASRPVWSL